MKDILKTPWILTLAFLTLVAILLYRYTQGDKPKAPLSKREESDTRKRLKQHTDKAAKDTARSREAFQAAATHYAAASKAAAAARTLHQQSHAPRPSTDTAAASLQRFFANY